MDNNITEESSDDSDSVVEENSDEETNLEANNHLDRNDKEQPRNGIIPHYTRKKLSILSKAGILLNKQLKKNNHKMHIASPSNGIVNDYIMEDVEFIHHAARLLDDFEKLNENAYLPVIKILFDWMKINPDVLKMSGKVVVLFIFSSFLVQLILFVDVQCVKL